MMVEKKCRWLGVCLATLHEKKMDEVKRGFRAKPQSTQRFAKNSLLISTSLKKHNPINESQLFSLGNEE
jgi:hypothetical protein